MAAINIHLTECSVRPRTVGSCHHGQQGTSYRMFCLVTGGDLMPPRRTIYILRNVLSGRRQLSPATMANIVHLTECHVWSPAKISCLHGEQCTPYGMFCLVTSGDLAPSFRTMYILRNVLSGHRRRTHPSWRSLGSYQVMFCLAHEAIPYPSTGRNAHQERCLACLLAATASLT